MQPFGTELPPTGPVVSSGGGSRAALILVVAAVVLVAVVGGVWYLLADGDGGTTAVTANQNQSGFAETPASDQPGGLAPVSGADRDTSEQSASERDEPATPSTTEAVVTAPTTSAPSFSGNLLTDGAAPAIDAIREAVGRETRFTELVVYDTYVIATYQDPGKPENLDRVTWRDGVVSAPDPQGLVDESTLLFSMGEVDLTTLPALADQALAGYDLANGAVTHAIVDRFFGLDDELAIRVYVSDPERGGGGYLLARSDGSVVELIG